MGSYIRITQSMSACVHYVEAQKVDEEDLRELRAELDTKQIRCGYVDCRTLLADPEGTCEAVALAVGAEHVPHGEKGHWVKLWDDMISLSVELPGLVIVMDHADLLLNADRSQVFNLTESFLIQFQHWLEKGKPCHLCFQMSPHPLVAQVFG